MTHSLNRFAHPIKRSKTVIGESELSYLNIDQDYDIPVIFLHGIPSSAELWREVMVLTNKDQFGFMPLI